MDLDGGARTVTVEQGTTPAGKDLSVSAEVTNGSLVKAGAGTLELKAANTYSGGTTVNAGTVLANNTSGSATGSGTVTVNGANAVLGGTGNVAGATTVTLGQIRPGTSSITGEMQFGSDLTLSGSTPGTRMTVRLGAALAADGNDSADFTSHLNDGSFGLWVLSQAAPLESMNGGVHDRASLTGNLNLNAGGQIFVDSLGYAPAFGDVFDLFDWANLSAGTFDFGGTHRLGGLIGDLSLPALNAGLAYDLSLFNAAGSSGIVLVVPEPSRAGLVFVALAALCLRRRRSVA